MQSYRLFFRSTSGNIRHRIDFASATDSQAYAVAQTHRDGRAMELWSDTRLLAGFPAERGQPSTGEDESAAPIPPAGQSQLGGTRSTSDRASPASSLRAASNVDDRIYGSRWGRGAALSGTPGSIADDPTSAPGKVGRGS